MIINLLLAIMFLTLIVFILIRMCLVIITIEQESMSPALHEGDRVLILRYWPHSWLQKGDIVLVWPWPSEIHNGKDPKPFGVIPYVKRVIGLPGDIIITGIEELDDYHKCKLRHTYDLNGNKKVIVPFNHFFVRGDYPIGGFDSRIWGPLSYESFLGLVIMKFSRSLPSKEGNSR